MALFLVYVSTGTYISVAKGECQIRIDWYMHSRCGRYDNNRVGDHGGGYVEHRLASSQPQGEADDGKEIICWDAAWVTAYPHPGEISRGGRENILGQLPYIDQARSRSKPSNVRSM